MIGALEIYNIVKDVINDRLHWESAEGSVGGCVVHKYSSNIPSGNIALEIANKISDRITEACGFTSDYDYEDMTEVIHNALERNNVESSLYLAYDIADDVGCYLDEVNGPVNGSLAKLVKDNTFLSNMGFDPKLLAERLERKILYGDTDGDKKPLPTMTAHPMPYKVWFNPPYTTVQFTDGTKVTVEQQNFEDQRFDEYVGFCCAVTKKMFASTTNAIDWFKRAKTRAIEESPKYKRKMKKEQKKRMMEIVRLNRQTLREEKIEKRKEELRIQREAEKRLKEESNG